MEILKLLGMIANAGLLLVSVVLVLISIKERMEGSPAPDTTLIIGLLFGILGSIS